MILLAIVASQSVAAELLVEVELIVESKEIHLPAI